MKINFRQGIVSHQIGGFLQINGNDVDLLASDRSTTVSVAHRDTNYTHSEDNTVVSAWVGPFTELNYYLYLDFNSLTFNRTFGYTTLEPVAQSAAPGAGNSPIVGVVPGVASPAAFGNFDVTGHYVLPVNKQFAVVNSTANDGTYTVQSAVYSTGTGKTTITVNEAVPDTTVDGELTLDIDGFGQPLYQDGRTWFDTANNVHYVLNGSTWTEVHRVFAAQLFNGTTFISLSQDSGVFTGTQIGNTDAIATGRVLYSEQVGDPMRRDDGTFFTTEDQFFTNQSRVDAIRLEANVTRAQSITGGTLPQFGIVAWTDDGQITSANYDDVGSTVVGVLTETLNYLEVGAVIVQGTVTNSAWNWTSSVSVGSALWVLNGELTATDPNISTPGTYPYSRVPVARVLSGDTIIFEQGLGGVGPQGPVGSIENYEPADTTNLGAVTLVTDSSDPARAYVISDTDPRLYDSRNPSAHNHPASEITFTPGSGISSGTVQNACLELAIEKLDLTGGVMTGSLTLNADPVDDLEPATKQYVDNMDLKHIVINTQIASYTLVIGDDNNLLSMNSGVANTLTIPTNAFVAFPIGTQILIVQEGVGQTTIAFAGTLHSASGLVSLAAQYSMATIIKKATDTWFLAGDLA